MLLDGLKAALAGLVVGLAVSFGAVRHVQSMRYLTQSLDPAVFGLVSIVLLIVAGAACIASQMHPTQGLRTE